MKTTSKKLNKSETLHVTAILYKIGNQTPYFAITGEIRDSRVRRDNGITSCGYLKDEILSAFPEFAPLVALHLSRQDGTPMYALENGWYWNGGTEYQEFDGKVLAEHLRITQEEADGLRDMDKDQFEAFVNSQRARWKAEADKAIQDFDLQVVS